VGSSVGASRALTDAPLFTAQALRYAAAAVLLLVIARSTGSRVLRPRGREWLWLGGVALTGLVLFNVAVVRGVAHAEPAVIAVAVACAPVLIGVFGPLLEGKRPTRRLVIAAVVVTAGGVLVVGSGRTDLAGLGWAVLGLLCEAGFTLLAVPVLRRLGPWGVSVHAVWIAAVTLALLGTIVDGPAAASRITLAQWAVIGYLAVMVTAVAFVLWYSAVAALGSGRAGLLTGVAPVAAAASGALLGAGLPGVPVWCGIVVVFCGLVVGLRSRGRSTEPQIPSPGFTRRLGQSRTRAESSRTPAAEPLVTLTATSLAAEPLVTIAGEPERPTSRAGTMNG
jgi:drug/metabolite transporter (DMT)-like permease